MSSRLRRLYWDGVALDKSATDWKELEVELPSRAKIALCGTFSMSRVSMWDVADYRDAAVATLSDKGHRSEIVTAHEAKLTAHQASDLRGALQVTVASMATMFGTSARP